MKQTFKEFLTEIFDTIVPYKWIYKYPDIWRAEFTINNMDYFILFSRDDEKYTKWDIVFDIKDRSEDEDPYSLSGTGNTHTIFGTLLPLIKEFTKKNPNVISIIFTADEESRKKMYNRFSKKLATTLGDWNLNIIERATNNYILTRPQY